LAIHRRHPARSATRRPSQREKSCAHATSQTAQ
jgi:hypothetical protein